MFCSCVVWWWKGSYDNGREVIEVVMEVVKEVESRGGLALELVVLYNGWLQEICWWLLWWERRWIAAAGDVGCAIKASLTLKNNEYFVKYFMN